MKKIISLLSVFAMIATMFTTVAFADENNAIYWVKDGDIVNNVLTMKLMIKTNENLKAAGARYDLKDAYAKGLTKADVAITATGTDVTANIMDTAVKAISFNLSTTAQDMTGDIHVLTATFDLTNASDSFVLGFAKAFSASNTSGARLNNFTADTYTVVVAKEDPKPTVAALEDGGKMYGMNTKVAEVSVPEGATASKATVTLGEESKTYDLPAGVKGQVGSFIAIIRYAADLVNPAFTLTVE